MELNYDWMKQTIVKCMVCKEEMKGETWVKHKWSEEHQQRMKETISSHSTTYAIFISNMDPCYIVYKDKTQ